MLDAQERDEYLRRRVKEEAEGEENRDMIDDERYEVEDDLEMAEQRSEDDCVLHMQEEEDEELIDREGGAEKGNLEAENRLLDCRDKHGNTALMIAVRKKNLELVKMLLDSGADGLADDLARAARPRSLARACAGVIGTLVPSPRERDDNRYSSLPADLPDDDQVDAET